MKNILLTDEYLEKARKVKTASRKIAFKNVKINSNNQNNFYYSSVPKEAVFKVIRDYKKGPISGYTVVKSIQYIGTEDELERKSIDKSENELDRKYLLEDQDGNLITSKKEILDIYNEWKKTFSSNERKNGKDAEHILFSTSEPINEATEKMILKAARKTLEINLKDKGYDYLLSLHKDKEHTHVHAIVRTHNTTTKKQLDLKKQDIKEIKNSWANNLQEQGLNYVVSINLDRIKDMSERLEIVEAKNNNWFRENIEKLKSDDIDELGKNLLSTQENIKELNSQKAIIQEKIKDIFYDKNKEDEKIKLKAELKVIDKKNSKLYADFKAYLKLLNEYETNVQNANRNYIRQKENLSKISGFFITQSLSYKKLDIQTEQARKILIQSRISLDKAHFYLNQINLDKKYTINLEKQKEIAYIFDNIQNVIKSNDKELISSQLIYNINKLEKKMDEYSNFLTHIDKKALNELLKIKEDVKNKSQIIHKFILPLKEYLEKNKNELVEDRYNKLISRIEKIENNLNADIPSLSVGDAKFLGINTDNLLKFFQDINYKKDVISEDLTIVETKNNFTIENIDLVNLNLKDIKFTESKIEEAIKISQISESIEPLQEYLKNEKINLPEKKYEFLENRLTKIKEKLDGDFPALSVNDAKFLGIDTTNLTAYEQEIKYKDKILASDLKTKEEFIVREVGIEIKASDLLTKKEFVVEEISKTSIVNNIDLVNLNLKDIKFKTSDLINIIELSQKTKAISESINPFIDSLESQKDKISIEHYNKLEKKLLNIKERLEKEYPSLSVQDAKYLGFDIDNLPKLESVEIKKEDGSVYTIQNIDLINLDISSLNEEKERIVAQKQEINRNEQLITKDINEVREVNHNIPTQEKINISSNEIESLKQMTLDELRITNPKPVLDALGITYKEQYGRLTFKTHAEKTASSNMYLDKNGVWKYKNFATGAGGTVENVIMDLTGMQYKEALNYAISNLGTKNYLDERFEDVKYENSVLRDEHLEKIKQLKEANINYQKESSSESKVVKIEEIYSTDKEVMDFLANRGIENIADGFYKITGQYEVNGKTFYNTGIGVLTNEHNISSNLEDVGADIHLLKPITLKNGNVLKTMSFGNKDITVLNNKDTNNKIAIFESKMDYAAAYSQDVEKFENTTSIISNGTGNYFKIVQELEKLNAAEKEVIFYNQNDKAGEIFITQIATKSNLDKFSFVKYQDNETGKDINDILKDKVNIEDRFLKEQTINEFIFNSKNKDDLEKVLNENPKIAIEEKKLIEERNLTFDKDDNSGFSKSITIERNAEIFRKIILEKEENIKYEKGLERLDEIKRYLNEIYPKLSIKDAKFLEIDVSKFKTTINEIPYKVFDFSQSEEMKKEFKEFAKDFPTFAKNILNEAIEKQEISFEKLSYIGIKPTQFKNLTNNDFENEKVDLSNNSELLKEFNKLAKRFPELAKNELDKSIKNSNITTGKLSKYGMTPVNFLNYKNEHISNETAEIEFIDFEKNNIYKKDFIINIDYENSKKDINQNLDISSFNNSINETRDFQKSIKEPNNIQKSIKEQNFINRDSSLKDLIIKEINFEEINKIFQARENKIDNIISHSSTNKEKTIEVAKQLCYSLYGNLQHIKDTQAHINNLNKNDDKLLDILNKNLSEHKKIARELNKNLNEFISNVNKSKFKKEEKIEIKYTIFESLEKIRYASNILENTNSKTIKESIKNRDIEEYKTLSLDLYYAANNSKKINVYLDKTDMLLKRIKTQELSLTDKLKIKAIQNHIGKSKNLHIKNAKQKEK
ncbi:hypothetical protein AAX26_01662 [Aliarcobacter thereius]|uniref:relaxase/mobilization nuclease domain-containing protein n=1 Tax=Aliarcobacter thereius TaxID=544718 RepID=UPI0008293590|nr:toprim domain-containing protein [Aliarcobacter thereius]OCL86012.1 hypothetical protein AAX26_01662 [Aliarcobacter thereius]